MYCSFLLLHVAFLFSFALPLNPLFLALFIQKGFFRIKHLHLVVISDPAH